MLILSPLLGGLLTFVRAAAQEATPNPPPVPTPTVPAAPAAKTVAATAPESPAELAARLSDLPQELPGWRLLEPPHACDRVCLAQEMPQDAALTLSYNFLWGLTVRLMPAEPQCALTARVYAMADELDAFGIYSARRTEAAVTAEIAVRSYWLGNELHIWRGPFALRLTPEGDDKLLRAAVLAAGEAFVERLPLPAQLPLMMRLMPQGRNVPQTLRYYRQNVLGQVALGDGLVERYLDREGELTLALLRAADPPSAVLLYGTVLQILDGPGAPSPVVDLGKAAAVVQSEQFGLSLAMREGRYVAVAINVRERRTAEGLLRIAATNVRIGDG